MPRSRWASPLGWRCHPRSTASVPRRGPWTALSSACTTGHTSAQTCRSVTSRRSPEALWRTLGKSKRSPGKCRYWVKHLHVAWKRSTRRPRRNWFLNDFHTWFSNNFSKFLLASHKVNHPSKPLSKASYGLDEWNIFWPVLNIMTKVSKMEKIKQPLRYHSASLKCYSEAPNYQKVKYFKQCSKKAGFQSNLFNYCQFTFCNDDKPTSKTKQL